MKSKLIALALILVSVGGSFANDPCGRTTSAGEKLLITEYGTLIDILGANGKSLYGRLDQDGFTVRYQVGGKVTSVSAVGSRSAKDLLPGKVKLEGKFASATVTTKDKLLEIRSYFRLDSTGKKLTIQRVLKNMSGQKLVLLGTKQYLAKRLIGTGKFRVEPGRLLESVSPVPKGSGRFSGEPGRMTQFLGQIPIGAGSLSQATVGVRDTFCERVFSWRDIDDCDVAECTNTPIGCPTGQCNSLSLEHQETVDVDAGGSILAACLPSEGAAEGQICCPPEKLAKNECECCETSDVTVVHLA